MSKRKRQELNVAEKFFIENHRGFSASEIAEKLGDKSRSDLVQVHLDSLPPLPTPKPPTAGEMMIHKTTERQVGGITIMTPQAATQGDLKKPAPKQIDLSDRIFKMKK